MVQSNSQGQPILNVRKKTKILSFHAYCMEIDAHKKTYNHQINIIWFILKNLLNAICMSCATLLKMLEAFWLKKDLAQHKKKKKEVKQ